jgi:hypothetical protein
MEEGIFGRPNSESPGSPVRSGRPMVDDAGVGKEDYMSGEVSVMLEVELVDAAVIARSLLMSCTVAGSRVSSIPVKSGMR